MGGVAWFAGFGSARIDNVAAPTLNRPAASLTADAELTDALQPTAMGNAGIGNVEVTRASELVRGTTTDRTAASDEPKSIVEVLPPETPPVQVATAGEPNAIRNDAKDAVSSIKIFDQCLIGGEMCIDRYLWALYQRTPKEDGQEEGQNGDCHEKLYQTRR